jgi:hypothetical protein
MQLVEGPSQTQCLHVLLLLLLLLLVVPAGAGLP